MLGAVVVVRLDATTHGPDARRQLTPAERLGDVVVGAEFEPEDPVELVTAGRQHDDRDRAALAELAAHVATIDVRKPEIEEHEVVARRREGVSAGGDVGDLMAVGAQPGHERLGDRAVVLDQQQLHPFIVEERRPAGRRLAETAKLLDDSWTSAFRPSDERRRTVAGSRRLGR